MSDVIAQSHVGYMEFAGSRLEGMESDEEALAQIVADVTELMQAERPFMFLGIRGETEDEEGRKGHAIVNAGNLGGNMRELVSLLEALKHYTEVLKGRLVEMGLETLREHGEDLSDEDTMALMSALMSVTELSFEELTAELDAFDAPPSGRDDEFSDLFGAAETA